jgi:hypothetical protein
MLQQSAWWQEKRWEEGIVELVEEDDDLVAAPQWKIVLDCTNPFSTHSAALRSLEPGANVEQ